MGSTKIVRIKFIQTRSTRCQSRETRINSQEVLEAMDSFPLFFSHFIHLVPCLCNNRDLIFAWQPVCAKHYTYSADASRRLHYTLLVHIFRQLSSAHAAAATELIVIRIDQASSLLTRCWRNGKRVRVERSVGFVCLLRDYFSHRRIAIELNGHKAAAATAAVKDEFDTLARRSIQL